MKHTLFLGLVAASLIGWAQKPQKTTPVKQVDVRWGTTEQLQAPALNTDAFRKLMGARVVPAEPGWQVRGFEFTYAERGMYEDSAGNPLMVVDYLTEFCPGDTLTKNIKTLLPSRVKRGDTAYIANIRLEDASGKMASGKPLRVMITK